MSDLVPPQTTAGSYTWQTRLCDDDGMVSREIAFQLAGGPPMSYLDVHNNLRAHTYGVSDRITEPFACTGSAHLAGEHIWCTSPAHALRPDGKVWVRGRV